MQGIIVPVTPFAQNCSLLWREETMKGEPIDPGVEIERILVAHGHACHCGGGAARALAAQR